MNALARISRFFVLFALLLGISALSHWHHVPQAVAAFEAQADMPTISGRMPAPDAKATDGNVQDLSH